LSNEDLTFSLANLDFCSHCRARPVAGHPKTTLVPIPEPQPQVITELDARNVKAPPLFKVTAPKGAPNVVIVLLDEMGFGHTGRNHHVANAGDDAPCRNP
jgi:hypothetical protein